MSANIKLGQNTLNNVDTIEVQNADSAGEYVQFGLNANVGDGLKLDESTNTLSVNVGSGLSINSAGALEATGGSGGSGLYYHYLTPSYGEYYIILVTTSSNLITSPDQLAATFNLTENSSVGYALAAYHRAMKSLRVEPSSIVSGGVNTHDGGASLYIVQDTSIVELRILDSVTFVDAVTPL